MVRNNGKRGRIPSLSASNAAPAINLKADSGDEGAGWIGQKERRIGNIGRL